MRTGGQCQRPVHKCKTLKACRLLLFKAVIKQIIERIDLSESRCGGAIGCPGGNGAERRNCSVLARGTASLPKTHKRAMVIKAANGRSDACPNVPSLMDTASMAAASLHAIRTKVPLINHDKIDQADWHRNANTRVDVHYTNGLLS